MENYIQKAINILNQGGIIIFPTDTAIGIGCRIDNEKAINKLFQIRKRPSTRATPVLVSGPGMAQKYMKPFTPEIKDNLISKYWPGALTIVYPCKTELVPALVRGGTGTLGVRMPNQQDVLSVIEGIGVPLLGPSANFHGEETPYQISELNINLIKQVDFILKGNCKLHQASTVIDCSVKPWKILRQGAVKKF